MPLIKEAYEEKNGILGYRQMTIKLNRENDFHVNQKRIYRLMQILGLKSVCRRKRKNYIKSTPQVTAENVLNREFSAENFGEKWLTDVTEMKYGVSSKAYLSAMNCSLNCSDLVRQTSFVREGVKREGSQAGRKLSGKEVERDVWTRNSFLTHFCSKSRIA